MSRDIYESANKRVAKQLEGFDRAITLLEKRRMSIPEMVVLLTERVSANNCDGDCGKEPPYTGCKECRAAEALNAAAEILREAI